MSIHVYTALRAVNCYPWSKAKWLGIEDSLNLLFPSSSTWDALHTTALSPKNLTSRTANLRPGTDRPGCTPAMAPWAPDPWWPRSAPCASAWPNGCSHGNFRPDVKYFRPSALWPAAGPARLKSFFAFLGRVPSVFLSFSPLSTPMRVSWSYSSCLFLWPLRFEVKVSSKLKFSLNFHVPSWGCVWLFVVLHACTG